jgi:hypothetical protein
MLPQLRTGDTDLASAQEQHDSDQPQFADCPMQLVACGLKSGGRKGREAREQVGTHFREG